MIQVPAVLSTGEGGLPLPRTLVFACVALASVLLADPVSAEGVLARIKDAGVIRMCADPQSPPYSIDDSQQPGIDIEIARLIAERLGLRLKVVWNETYFTGRAIRRQLFRQRKCDGFLGLPIGRYDEGLSFTRPYYGSGYVLVVRDGTDRVTLADLKSGKIGVEVWTIADGELHDRGYERGLYRNQMETIEALQRGEVDAGLLWAPVFGWIKLTHPELKVTMADGYVPEPALRRNIAVGLRKEDDDLRAALDRAIGDLLAGGAVPEVLARYGVRFYPPFE